VTEILQNYCLKKPAELKDLCGFIFKSRSPSCGLNSTPVYIDKQCMTETGRGLFAKHLCAAYPELIVIEDNNLNDKDQLKKFTQSIQKRHASVNKNIS